MEPVKALVVDDNDQFSNICIEDLKDHARVEVVGRAKNGMEAVAFARSLQPDLVLMDIHMHGMSGFEAARQIKELSPTTKIIFVSIEEKTTFRALGRLLGIDGYVRKNFFREEFPKTFQKLYKQEIEVNA